MTSLWKSLGTVTALAAAVSLTLAGCTSSTSSGSTGKTSAATSSTGATNSSSNAGAALPDDQQNLTYVTYSGCTSLDATANFTDCAIDVDSQIMQGLVSLDSKGQPHPLLATSWKWTTPTTLQFQLRSGVTFSDGAQFSSADVKATLDRYIAQKSVLATQLAVITSYTADTPTTFTIHTSAPTGTLLGLLSMIYIGEAAHSTSDSYWAKPIGTGPFVLTNFVQNDHITLTRNDSYWGTKAKLKTLTFKQINDPTSRITALANGQAQVVSDVSKDQIPTIKRMSNVTFKQSPSYTYNFLWYQNSRKPFDNPDVRRALWEALDLKTIVSSLLGDTAATMTSLCPEAAFGCLPSSKAPKYDPAGAKALLAKAGYPNGFTTTIDYSTANVGNDQLVAAMISYWKAIGVTVKPKADDQATFLKAIAAPGNFDMIVNPNLDSTGDADFTLHRLYTCAAGRLGYCDKSLDQLLTQGQQETDATKRLAIYQQISDILATDAPAVGLYQININVAELETVQGLTMVPSQAYDWSTVYLTK